MTVGRQIHNNNNNNNIPSECIELSYVGLAPAYPNYDGSCPIMMVHAHLLWGKMY